MGRREQARSPDGDGDAGTPVALLLVLASAAPHQDVAVLQLLRRRRRQPRATFPARGGQEMDATSMGTVPWAVVGVPGRPSFPRATLRHCCELLSLPFFRGRS